MKKPFFRSYLILGVLLFLTLCIPQSSSSLLRSGFVGFSIPLFKSARWIMQSSLGINLSVPSEQMQSKLETLQIENLTLRAQIDRIYTWLEQEEHLEGISEKQRLSHERINAIKEGLQQQSQFLPAKVVFREPASWSSFIWIDIGNCENKRMGFDLVAENSPVISGSTLIGIVEYVGHKRSKVRLITDSALTPAISVTSKKSHHRFLLEHIDPLLRILPLQQNLFDCTASIKALTHIQEQMISENAHIKTAKGFIEGLSQPLWRLGNQTLKGIGFFQENATSLEVGDLIQTSGLDGVFPEGLKIGVVSKVDAPKRGDSTYQFNLELAASNLDQLSHVHVIPPCR